MKQYLMCLWMEEYFLNKIVDENTKNDLINNHIYLMKGYGEIGYYKGEEFIEENFKEISPDELIFLKSLGLHDIETCDYSTMTKSEYYEDDDNFEEE